MKKRRFGQPAEDALQILKDSTIEAYMILQLRPEDDRCFRSLGDIRGAGLDVDMKEYQVAYVGWLSSAVKDPDPVLERLYEMFNSEERPEDFEGHSLSVSDIVVLHDPEETTAWYVDDVGFEEVPV